MAKIESFREAAYLLRPYFRQYEKTVTVFSQWGTTPRHWNTGRKESTSNVHGDLDSFIDELLVTATEFTVRDRFRENPVHIAARIGGALRAKSRAINKFLKKDGYDSAIVFEGDSWGVVGTRPSVLEIMGATLVEPVATDGREDAPDIIAQETGGETDVRDAIDTVRKAVDALEGVLEVE